MVPKPLPEGRPCPPRCNTNPILQSFQRWDRAQLKTAVHTLHKHCYVVSCPMVDRTLAGRKKPHLRFSQWEWIAKQHPWHKSDGNFAGEMVAHYRYNHWSQLAMFIWMLCLAAPLEKLSPAPSPHELSFAQLWWLMGPNSWVSFPLQPHLAQPPLAHWSCPLWSVPSFYLSLGCALLLYTPHFYQIQVLHGLWVWHGTYNLLSWWNCMKDDCLSPILIHWKAYSLTPSSYFSLLVYSLLRSS